MELISGYMGDAVLRHALNDLTQRTFGFDFEGWVTGGYYEGDYIPYSFIEDGKILSNVSANRMTFMQCGRKQDYIQIGTVMTDPGDRGRGLARKLIEHVAAQYKDLDGIYLFGNLDAVGFYRKCGFSEGRQYAYSVRDEYLPKAGSDGPFIPLKECGPSVRDGYLSAVRSGAVNSSLEQINRYGLTMFYTASMDDVSYDPDTGCYIVTEAEGDSLVLKSIISREQILLKDVLSRLTGNFQKLRLGFTPLPQDIPLCDEKIFDGGDDYRLFYSGSQLESIERERLYFPELSHA